MAIIKCREEDGTLAPSTVEFEPGDTIQFESHAPVYVLAGSSVATQALRSFTLREISVQAGDGAVLVKVPVQAGSCEPEASPDALISKPTPAPVPDPPPDNDPRLPPPFGGPSKSYVPRPITLIVPPPKTTLPRPR